VSGNPLRFESGALSIRPDIEWQARMNRRHRRLITSTTWPLLIRYGYLGPKAQPDSSKSRLTLRRHSQRKSVPSN
jgi:hypothetical protein